MLRALKVRSSTFLHSPWISRHLLLKIASEYCELEEKHKDCELGLYEFRLELLIDIDILLMFEGPIQKKDHKSI